MKRLVLITALFAFSLFAESCQSACKKSAKTNSALLTGQHKFGMKNKKYKKQNRRGAY